MDYNAIPVWTAVVASLTAIIALLCESSRSRFQLGVDMLLKFNDKFASDEFRKARRKAARGLKQGTNDDADDVLDFFEMIGLLVRRKAINEKFVWHSFFYSVHRYCLLSKDYIASSRKEDATIWEDLIWLHSRLTKLEKKLRRCSDDGLKVSTEELNDFIKYEQEI